MGKSKVIGTIDITPNPWFLHIMAGRYKEAEEMKREHGKNMEV